MFRVIVNSVRVVNTCPAGLRCLSTGGRVANPAKSEAMVNEPEKGPFKTPLYNFHVQNGGKMVNFCNFMLPVQYSDLGIKESHNHTRTSCSVFDVSHMLQTYLRGKDAVECFESICTADINGLANGAGTLTVFTNEEGGIHDDLIVNRIADDALYVVSNAGCRESDKKIMQDSVEAYKKMDKSVDIEFLEPTNYALLAVQGPKAEEALQELASINLRDLYFMTTSTAEVAGVPDCRITRCGYTGEDGFEVAIPGYRSTQVVTALKYSKTPVKMAGLGARDSLRLEAGLCLYGSDIDTTVTPIEAGLTWLVAKRRRAEANFPGAAKILDQIKNGCSKYRVGIRMEEGPPARHDAEIMVDSVPIGKITSGCPSPSLGYNIAMGYVTKDYRKAGTNVEVKIREKLYKGQVVKMPFLKTNYYIKPSGA